ncbi:MAG: hypothetical protein ACYC5K_02400 [Saccharofermentanales bacterium]
MNEIPEEIRKMFPDQPIHLMDIDENGNLQILASSEPLENESDFENMPIEQVNQYLREHGYDPEQVALEGKILVEALIENINLKSHTEAAEKRVYELRNALLLILDQVDYTSGACRMNEMVGAVLGKNLIETVRRILKGGGNE